MEVENVEFVIGADQLHVCARTNNNKVAIAGIDLEPDQACKLAYLANQPQSLKVEISIIE